MGWNNWSVVVVRNDGPEGTKAKARLTSRERFALKRDSIYVKRKMNAYGLVWTPERNPLTGIQRYRLVFGDIEAVAVDAGLMSCCHVTVGKVTQRRQYEEEEFSGFGGVQVAALRGTQHVLAIIEQQARFAEEAMDVEA